MVRELTISEIAEKKTSCCKAKPFVIIACPDCNNTIGIDNVEHNKMSKVLQDKSGVGEE